MRKRIYLNVSLDKRPKANKSYALYVMELCFKYELLGTILYENPGLVPVCPYFTFNLLIYSNMKVRIPRKDWLLLSSSELFLFLLFHLYMKLRGSAIVSNSYRREVESSFYTNMTFTLKCDPFC